MLGSEGLFPDRQRALMERLRLGVTACDPVKRRQIIEALAHIRMPGSEGLFPDRQRALVERLGFGPGSSI